VSLYFCVAIGRRPHQAIVIGKGQTGEARDGGMTGWRILGDKDHIISHYRLHAFRGNPHRFHGTKTVTANTIYSSAFARPRRGQLSQLMTASQAVDGLRTWFDNAHSVE
jgi:hypothetical protein